MKNLKIFLIIICIIVTLGVGTIMIIKCMEKEDNKDIISPISNEPILEQPIEKKVPTLIRYDENGKIIKTIEVNSEELHILDIWIDGDEYYLVEDGELDEEIKNIKKDVAIIYNDSIEIYIELGQEDYCYYINREKNIASIMDMFEGQYAWVEEKIGGIDKEGEENGISYKIYDNYNQGRYDYTKRGYYWDSLNQPCAPVWYVITSGQRPELSYIIIQDIKVDSEKNVEIIVKEHIGDPTYPDVVGYPIPKIYPSCCIEFPYESAEIIKSISIKNTEGEIFQRLN